MFFLESVPIVCMVLFISINHSSGKWRGTIKTSEFKELMLNAVALNAILDVDECLGRLGWMRSHISMNFTKENRDFTTKGLPLGLIARIVHPSPFFAKWVNLSWERQYVVLILTCNILPFFMKCVNMSHPVQILCCLPSLSFGIMIIQNLVENVTVLLFYPPPTIARSLLHYPAASLIFAWLLLLSSSYP